MNTKKKMYARRYLYQVVARDAAEDDVEVDLQLSGPGGVDEELLGQLRRQVVPDLGGKQQEHHNCR